MFSVRSLPLILLLLASFTIAPQSSAGDNRALYIANCAACHGKGGEGGKGPALRKEGLLRTVSHEYFTRTMTFGRPLLGCPSFKDSLSSSEMSGIAAHIKSWQEGEDIAAPAHEVAPSFTERGEQHFMLCGGCHGTEGEGAMSPPLLDPGLLSSITDAELRAVIMFGRPGTPMKGYLKGMGGLAVLSPEEIDEIISYIRHRQKKLK